MSVNSTVIDQQYPRLDQLIGGYFHQDWSLEYASPQAAIDDYRDAVGPEAHAAASEIDRLLASSDDDQLASALDTLHNEYAYDEDGLTARAWLEAVRDRLRM